MISWLSRVPVRLSATAVSTGVCIALLVGVATASAQQTGPPVNGAPPVVKGKTRDGAKLKATPGDWSGAKATYGYSWERCNASGGECEPVAGAAANKYPLTPADVGHRLVAVVTASNSEGSGEARSAPSAVIAAVAPRHKGRVATAGEPVDGRVLSVGNGAWRGTPPFTYTYQWTRCGGGCTPIAGATSSTYRATTEDIGKKLYATITAKNGAGSGSQRSKPTTKVVAGSPLDIALPRVAGIPLVGQTLSAEDGTWVGTPPIAYAYQWYACSLSGCEPITGETEPSHTVAIGEFGDGFEVEVTAKNAQGSASATSEESSIAGGNVPVSTEAPSISGEAKEGQLLTASSGKWAGTEPITFEYEWLRCNTGGAECTQAAGASVLPTYLAAAADVGHTLRVKVIAKNLAGSGEAESVASETVKGVVPTNVVLPVTVPLVSTTSGSTVTATEGTWTGTQPISYVWEWKLCTSATSCKVEQKGSSNSFKVPAASGGKKLRVNVIATNTAGTAEKEALELTILI